MAPRLPHPHHDSFGARVGVEEKKNPLSSQGREGIPAVPPRLGCNSGDPPKKKKNPAVIATGSKPASLFWVRSDSDRLIPLPANGGAGWGYWKSFARSTRRSIRHLLADRASIHCRPALLPLRLRLLVLVDVFPVRLVAFLAQKGQACQGGALRLPRSLRPRRS
jgi:hypothetical protein